MTIYVLTEPFFEGGSWCMQVCSGLNDALRMKKLDAQYLCGLENIIKACDAQTFLLIIGSNPGFIGAAVRKASENGLRPVLLCARLTEKLPCACSYICSEVREATDYLLEKLKADGAHAAALYGCNKASASDLARKDCFLANTVLPTAERDIFYNDGSLADCFTRFERDMARYDSVICVNGYAALHLMRRLREMGKEGTLRVSAFGETMLTRRTFPSLLTVSARYEEYGKAAIAVCELLAKNPALDAVSVSVKWHLSDEREEPSHVFEAVSPADTPADARFYEDTEMREMLRIENMLLSCDETDTRILELAARGETIDSIAAGCYLSEYTVKYRLKKLRTMCGCRTKEELIRKLTAYTA